MPVSRLGRLDGSCTFHKICRRDAPYSRDRSIRLKSVDFRPCTALDRMGKKAMMPAISDSAMVIWSNPTQIRISGAMATTGVTCRITA